jgi:hypothetical protein
MFLGAIVVAVAGALYVANHIRITSKDGAVRKDISLELPGGQFDFHAAKDDGDAPFPGFPVYPGAERQKQANVSFNWTSSDGHTSDKSLSVRGGEYISGDSAATVFAWYRERLPKWEEQHHESRDEFSIETESGGLKRVISVRAKADGTHIGAATFGKPEAN